MAAHVQEEEFGGSEGGSPFHGIDHCDERDAGLLEEEGERFAGRQDAATVGRRHRGGETEVSEGVGRGEVAARGRGEGDRQSEGEERAARSADPRDEHGQVRHGVEARHRRRGEAEGTPREEGEDGDASIGAGQEAAGKLRGTRRAADRARAAQAQAIPDLSFQDARRKRGDAEERSNESLLIFLLLDRFPFWPMIYGLSRYLVFGTSRSSIVCEDNWKELFNLLKLLYFNGYL